MKVREQCSTDDLLSLALRSVARSKCRFNLRGLAILDNDIKIQKNSRRWYLPDRV